MPITLHRWRVTTITSDQDRAWKMKGKVLRWAMSEEEARQHEAATGRALEQVPGSGWTPPTLTGPLGVSTDPRPPLK